MLRAIARVKSGASDAIASRGSPHPIAEQGRAVSSPRPPIRLATGFMGRTFSRAWLQTQRLAHAMCGRTAPALGHSRRRATHAAGTAFGSERVAPRRVDSLAI